MDIAYNDSVAEFAKKEFDGHKIFYMLNGINSATQLLQSDSYKIVIEKKRLADIANKIEVVPEHFKIPVEYLGDVRY